MRAVLHIRNKKYKIKLAGETYKIEVKPYSYIITIENSPYGTVKNGSTTITSGTKVDHGTALTVIPTAVTGYTTTVSATTGTINNNKLTVNGPETIIFNQTAHEYTVVFNGNGSTDGSMDNQAFTYGTAQKLSRNAFSKSYAVTYDANGGSCDTLSDTATYDFDGWATSNTGSKVYTDEQSVENLTSENNGTVNLYAKWASGSITLPTPTRDGYTFKGWASSSTATSGSTGDYQVDSNITLYAIWEANTYNIYYRNDSGWATEGTLPETQSRTYPNTVTLAANNMAKSDTTDEIYEVTFNPNGGSCSDSSKTATKKRTYTADGWTTDEKSVVQTYANGATLTVADANTADDLTLYPCFTQSVSTSSIKLPAATRIGYAFKGWASSPDAVRGGTGSYTPIGNVTLYAIWAINSYAITIENSSYGTVKNGSTIINSGDKVDYNTTLTMDPTATTGYTTTVSSSTGTISDNKLTVDGAETITFNRTGNTYTVTYDMGTATGGTLPAEQTRTYPNTVTLATNNMTKRSTTDATYTVTFNYNGNGTANTTATALKTRSYTANGWTKTSGSTTQTYANGATLSNVDAETADNLTLYPCFTQSVSTDSVTLPTPTREGYKFSGWSKSPIGAGGGTTGTYTPTADITLYAIWTELPTLEAPIVTASKLTGSQASVTVRNDNSATVTLYIRWTDRYGDSEAEETSITISPQSSATATYDTTAEYMDVDMYFQASDYQDSPATSVALSLPQLSAPTLVSTSHEARTSTDEIYRYAYDATVSIKNPNSVEVKPHYEWTADSAVFTIGTPGTIPAGGTDVWGCNTDATGAKVTVYFSADNYIDSPSLVVETGQGVQGGEDETSTTTTTTTVE